jgi:transcriptional regulator with XRE-family HTH domain
MNTLPQAIRGLREARGLSRPALAERANVSRVNLWAIENDRISPGLATLERIASALDVGMGRLLSKPNAEFLLENSFVRTVRPFLPRLDYQQRQHLLTTLCAAPRRKHGTRSQ